MSKRKNVRKTTPFGIAGFCSLMRPNTKFKADGEYNASIVLDESDPEVAKLIGELQELYEQSYQEALAEVRKDKPKVEQIKRADPPFKHPEDPDTGEQLPGWKLNARLAAVRKDKDGTVIGTRRPVVVDISGTKSVTEEPGSGSEIRLSFDASPFYTAALGAGLSLRLVGVQVRKLVAIGVGDPGFGAVEGDYEAGEVSSAPAPAPAQAAKAEAQPEPAAGDAPAEW